MSKEYIGKWQVCCSVQLSVEAERLLDSMGSWKHSYEYLYGPLDAVGCRDADWCDGELTFVCGLSDLEKVYEAVKGIIERLESK